MGGFDTKQINGKYMGRLKSNIIITPINKEDQKLKQTQHDNSVPKNCDFVEIISMRLSKI